MTRKPTRPDMHPAAPSPGHPSGRRTRRASAFLALLAGFLAGCAARPPLPVHDLTSFLQPATGPLATVLADPATYRFQVLVSEVVDRPGHPPELRRHGYRVDAEYFYPASSIKLCAAVAALQCVEQLERQHAVEGLVDVPIEIGALFPGDPPQVGDPTHRAGGHITVAHQIRKLALVSDNPAYNRLLELVGHEALNRSMHDLGLRSAVLNHRLSDPRTFPDPYATAAVTLLPPGRPPIALPARNSPLRLTNTAPGLRVGSAHMQSGRRVPEPLDFTRRNGISLVDLQDLLVRVVRPDIGTGRPGLVLSPDHRELLVDALTRYPGESDDPRYDRAEYPDAYAKFLLPGIRRVFPEDRPGRRVEIAAKIGRAYGFSVENSYLHHPGTGRAVFVTAVLYTNDDGILNDDRYEYDTVADPVLADLGERVARRWLATPAE